MIQLLAGTAIINKGKILLLKHIGDTEQNGKWGPPAGHGEVGENPEETAVRETKEETNLEVKLTGLVQIGYLIVQSQKDYIWVLYHAKAKNLKNLKIQKEEASDYAWVSASELKTDGFPLRASFLREPILKALTESPAKNNLFKVFKIED